MTERDLHFHYYAHRLKDGRWEAYPIDEDWASVRRVFGSESEARRYCYLRNTNKRTWGETDRTSQTYQYEFGYQQGFVYLTALDKTNIRDDYQTGVKDGAGDAALFNQEVFG